MNGNNRNKIVILRDFFVYEVNFLALLAGTQATGNINIQADSDFELNKLALFADIAGAAQTYETRVVPLVNLQITDSGSGRNLLEPDVPAPNIFGRGELAFILTNPKTFSSKSTITITATNFSAATDYNLRLSFIGTKVFYS